jgi:hypothetical protein
MMNDVENVLLEVLDDKVEKNEAIPSYRTAQGLTFQIITKTAFAMDIDSQKNENVLVFYLKLLITLRCMQFVHTFLFYLNRIHFTKTARHGLAIPLVFSSF